jgi:hypothetical protein
MRSEDEYGTGFLDSGSFLAYLEGRMVNGTSNLMISAIIISPSLGLG